MNKQTKRIVIYAKDIMQITGVSERTARRIIAAIRAKLEKPKGYISIKEFCDYMGFDMDHVLSFLA